MHPADEQNCIPGRENTKTFMMDRSMSETNSNVMIALKCAVIHALLPRSADETWWSADISSATIVFSFFAIYITRTVHAPRRIPPAAKKLFNTCAKMVTNGFFV